MIHTDLTGATVDYPRDVPVPSDREDGVHNARLENPVGIGPGEELPTKQGGADVGE